MAVEKKTETKARAPRKTAAKKTAPAAVPSINLYLQYQGMQISQEEMVEVVRKDLAKSGIAAEPVTMELYIKPEEMAVYYVVNGTETGRVNI